MELLALPLAKPRFTCPLSGFQAVTAGKHKLRVLWALRSGPLHFGELKRAASVFSEFAMTPKGLSRELKALESHGLVAHRTVPGTVRRTEYRLAPLGEELIPLVGAMCQWALTHFEIISPGPEECPN